MKYLKKGTFWGIILILLGISIILKGAFNIYLPVIRILFGCILIYWGGELLGEAAKKIRRRSSRDNEPFTEKSKPE